MADSISEGSLCAARSQLRRWGLAVRAFMRSYPAMSAHEKVRSGAGVMSIEPELPADLQAVESAVNASPQEHRVILIEHYTKEGRGNEHAARLGLSRQHYSKRKREAESYIAARL